MSTEVQVFLPKFRNKQQYKCIIERAFNEAIEEATTTSISPKNRMKKGLIDVVTPRKELDQQLAQDIISIKPQSGGGVVQLKKLNEIKSRIMSSSVSRQISPSKIIESQNVNKNSYLTNNLYKNYKYKSINDNFHRDLLNNSCDIVRNTQIKSKIRDFQFQLYHKKHHPQFELTDENINQLTTIERIQFNFQKIEQNPAKVDSQLDNLEQKITDENVQSNQHIHINNNDSLDIQKSIDKALIKTMKNSLDSARYYNSNLRSKSGLKGRKNPLTLDKLDFQFPISQTSELDVQRQPQNKINHQNQLSSLPPIFSLDQFQGDIDKMYGIAKMASKGKMGTDKFVVKDNTSSFPSTALLSPTYTGGSPSSKCRTESNYRRRSSSINGTNFIKRNDSSVDYKKQLNQKTLITTPNEETEESLVKLDSIIKQQKVRNVQDISEKIHSQLKFNTNEIKEAIDSIRNHFWGSTTKDKYYKSLSQEQLYYEFLQLCQVSHKILEMHRQNYISLPSEIKKNQVKLMDLIKETDKTVLLDVMYEAFPVLKDNIDPLKSRILDSLNFKLPKQIDRSTFYTIGWEEFQNFINLAITKLAPLSDVANFIVKFFNISHHKYIQVDDFLYNLKTICSKVDKYVDSKSKKTIYSAFEQNFKLLGFIKPGLSVFSSSQLKLSIMQNKTNHNELIDLIFESF